MPGWDGSTRRERLPADWPERRRVVLHRDGERCQHTRADTGLKCGAFANQVDHIHADDDHDYSNLQALCEYHHGVKSGREGGIASGKARRGKRDAVKPQHPGVLAEPRKPSWDDPAPSSDPAPF